MIPDDDGEELALSHREKEGDAMIIDMINDPTPTLITVNIVVLAVVATSVTMAMIAPDTKR